MAQKPPPQIPHIGIKWIAAALALAVAAGWWMAQSDKRSKPDSPGTAPQTKKDAPATNPTTPPAGQPPMDPANQAGTPPPIATEVPRAEEEKLHHWLTESETPADAAAAMLADWKNLSEPGKVATARHLSNLVADGQFAPLQNLLLAPDTSREVKEVLFTDMLNRPNPLKWPVIFQIMRQKDHPFSTDARNMLSVVLGADYGDDWAKWQERVQEDLVKE